MKELIEELKQINKGNKTAAEIIKEMEKIQMVEREN